MLGKSCYWHWNDQEYGTDLFILALRRFIARRGNIKSIRCDNEINFIGTEKKLEKSMNEMDNKRIENSKEKI